MLLSHERRTGDARASPAADGPGRWLRDTSALQLGHPQLRIQVKKLTQLRPTPRDQAVACFDFVRALPFRAVQDPGGASSCGVLRAGSGDAYTKGLLFVAMLRSLAIPARLRAVSLRPAVLEGLLRIERRAIVHVLTEVYLEGRWLQVDAYCADLQLALAARARLLREGRRAGYGVHMHGAVVWDGGKDAFGCIAPGDPDSLPIEDLGVYDDPSQMTRDESVLRQGWLAGAGWMVGAVVLNWRIRALRESIRPSTPRGGLGALH